jgi:hypothetical protein
MSYSITFTDYTPPAKFNNLPWLSAIVQETNDPVNGIWLDIDQLDLTPLDADPTQPASRTFTTENGTIPNGWYRVIFKDTIDAMAIPSEPVHNVVDETAPYLPTIQDIASLMRARTVDTFGKEGTFDASTRPTGEDVVVLIDQATSDVTTAIDTDIPPGAYRYAKQAIIYRTAMLIELGYWPEQINTGRSPYAQYEALFNDFFINLKSAIEREQVEAVEGESAASAGMAAFSFPDYPTAGSVRW